MTTIKKRFAFVNEIVKIVETRSQQSSVTTTHDMNIIFDLRRINISEDKCVLELKLRFAQKRDVKRLLIIKKNGESLRFSR